MLKIVCGNDFKLLINIIKKLRGESHIDFHTQYAIMTLAGGGLLLMTP